MPSTSNSRSNLIKSYNDYAASFVGFNINMPTVIFHNNLSQIFLGSRNDKSLRTKPSSGDTKHFILNDDSKTPCF